jgi:uncharacterized membrane protein
LHAELLDPRITTFEEHTRMARLQEEHGWQERTTRHPERLATGLGWFSIGLGLAEVAAPGTMAQLIGVRDSDRSRSLLRSFGAREIATGVAILRSNANPQWMWARVGGDALDLSTLAGALDGPETNRTRLMGAMAAVAGVAAADAYCAARLSRGRRRALIHFRKTFTVNRQPDVVYGFWRQLDNLPRFMRHLESVEVLDNRRSRWRAKAPAGMTVEWNAEIVEDLPNERIAWRSLPGATVPNRGTVRFTPAPGARGTEVHVEMDYSVPGGKAASALARVFGEEPEQQVADDMRRLKQVLETGEIARSGGSASVWQPAQPAPAELRRQMAAEGERR